LSGTPLGAIFESPDDVKFCSSMSLFSRVAGAQLRERPLEDWRLRRDETLEVVRIRVVHAARVPRGALVAAGIAREAGCGDSRQRRLFVAIRRVARDADRAE
jgi:hypothetical protein